MKARWLIPPMFLSVAVIAASSWLLWSRDWLLVSVGLVLWSLSTIFHMTAIVDACIGNSAFFVATYKEDSKKLEWMALRASEYLCLFILASEAATGNSLPIQSGMVFLLSIWVVSSVFREAEYCGRGDDKNK